MLLYAFLAGWLFATGHKWWGCAALALALVQYDWSTPVENIAWLWDHVT